MDARAETYVDPEFFHVLNVMLHKEQISWERAFYQQLSWRTFDLIFANVEDRKAVFMQIFYLIRD